LNIIERQWQFLGLLRKAMAVFKDFMETDLVYLVELLVSFRSDMVYLGER